jgi:hypothetical protein
MGGDSMAKFISRKHDNPCWQAKQVTSRKKLPFSSILKDFFKKSFKKMSLQG